MTFTLSKVYSTEFHLLQKRLFRDILTHPRIHKVCTSGGSLAEPNVRRSPSHCTSGSMNDPHKNHP